MRIVALLLTAAIGLSAAAEFPQAEITNGTVTAKFYLPDAERGYYRGTRFDWSGNTYSLKFAGHEFLGQWFERYDPKLHDAIMGPVEEFRTGDSALGYDEAKTGETFIRIGVGTVRKPQEKAFLAFRTYEIVDPGKWTVKRKRSSIEFTHTLTDKSGYAYVYRKTIRLIGKSPVMRIEHVLENKGRKPIETAQYNHNFFVLDNQPTGPGTSVRFVFEPKSARGLGRQAEIRGKDIVFTAELRRGQSAFSELTGFGPTAADYDIRIENRKAGTGVHIAGDRPLVKMVFWAIRTTACPEPYVQMRVEPGKKEKWNIRYELYELGK